MRPARILSTPRQSDVASEKDSERRHREYQAPPPLRRARLSISEQYSPNVPFESSPLCAVAGPPGREHLRRPGKYDDARIRSTDLPPWRFGGPSHGMALRANSEGEERRDVRRQPACTRSCGEIAGCGWALVLRVVN